MNPRSIAIDPVPLRDETRASRATRSWPDRQHILFTMRSVGLLTVMFLVVFGFTNAVTALHVYRVPGTTALDTWIPLVPSATLLYSSLYAMFAFTPFVLRTESEVCALARVIRAEILLAGVFFLLLPMDPRPISGELGRWAAAFRAADRLNLDYNNFPSLHATFALTFAAAFAARCARPAAITFLCWGAAIVVAALVTYQHTLIDVAGAVALSAGALITSDVRRSTCDVPDVQRATCDV